MSKSSPPLTDPHRLDVHAVFEAMRAGKASDRWLEGWVPATHAAPERFWEAVYAYAATKRGSAWKSRTGEGYDFYYDCVLAHVARKKAAIVAREARSLWSGRDPRDAGEWRDVSFELLHYRCTSLAAAWARAGVTPGMAVCIVLPMGIDFVVCVATALRMGLTVSTLPPRGATFVRTRLEALEPERVVTSDRLRRLVGPFESTILPASGTGDAAGSASDAAAFVHTYAADHVVLRLLSPFGLDPNTPVEITAASLHASLLGDGLFAYGIDASDTIAAPAFDPLQFQPVLLLTSLMAGATYVEMDPRDIEQDPKVLERFGVTVLGVRRAVRELLLRPDFASIKPAQRAWFRSLTEVLDTSRWDELGKQLAEKKLLAFGVLANAASVGCHLLSPRASSALGLRVWPAPGRTWQLSEVAGGALPALNESGVYTAMIEEAPDASLPRVVIARTGDSYVYAGAMDLGPDAQTYPVDEVAAVVERHPGVRHAAVIVAPGGWINDAKVVLLVFVDPPGATGGGGGGASDEEASTPRIPAIAERIAREMGEAYAPNRIEIFPLRPRFLEGEPPRAVDRAWCRSQYLGGALTQKARMPLFTMMATLGYIFAGARPDE